MAPTVYALVDDLLFASKLDLAARGQGVALRLVASRRELLSEVRLRRPALVVLDLNAEHLEPLEALRDLAGEIASEAVPTVAYCSHVDRDLMKEAASIGGARVMSRGAFVEHLSEIFRTASA